MEFDLTDFSDEQLERMATNAKAHGDFKNAEKFMSELEQRLTK